jgi:hypothetical protein
MLHHGAAVGFRTNNHDTRGLRWLMVLVMEPGLEDIDSCDRHV